MLARYFKSLYQRTMREAYDRAYKEIAHALEYGGDCLDCGASRGRMLDIIKEQAPIKNENYHGIEWSDLRVEKARANNINVIKSDLNKKLPFTDNKFRCVFGLSVIEHLLYPCRYLSECYRVLDEDGSLIILTPNISTYFTAMLILLGKMPSSGPHPDSDHLLRKEQLFKVSHDNLQTDSESDIPMHRHLVIFSYRVLKDHLKTIGFRDIKGYGFGLYPFPNFMQPLLERIDPFHCHQMVLVARK